MPVFSYDALQLNKGRGFVKCCTQGNNSEQEFNANIKAASECVSSKVFISCGSTAGFWQRWQISDFVFEIQEVTNEIDNSCTFEYADYHYYSFVYSRWTYLPNEFQISLKYCSYFKKNGLLCCYSGASAIWLTSRSNIFYLPSGEKGF